MVKAGLTVEGVCVVKAGLTIEGVCVVKVCVVKSGFTLRGGVHVAPFLFSLSTGLIQLWPCAMLSSHPSSGKQCVFTSVQMLIARNF